MKSNITNHKNKNNSFSSFSFNPPFSNISPQFENHEYDSKPTTINISISISLFEAYKGCKFPVPITRWKIENNKQIEQTETIYIDIPKGIDNNEIITIKDKGNQISNNNKGSIEVKINIENSTFFERNGIDLIFKKHISLKDSLCGFTFDLPYIDGREFKINNEAGNIIPPDFRKTIPKLGMTRDNEIGDLIIIFDVIYPKTLTKKQIEELSSIL